MNITLSPIAQKTEPSSSPNNQLPEFIGGERPIDNWLRDDNFAGNNGRVLNLLRANNGSDTDEITAPLSNYQTTIDDPENSASFGYTKEDLGRLIQKSENEGKTNLAEKLKVIDDNYDFLKGFNKDGDPNIYSGLKI
ncbi:MAG: hypothetical protein MK033_07540 [Candidatus Caenarcaniphilales bacterium]|nr:hypothetical protein [Candidatus Caenarcaniphilales bacterium]